MNTTAVTPTDDVNTHGWANRLMPLIVFAVTLAVMLVMLSYGPLSGTEGHRGLTAHEIVESGNWIVPRLYGQDYLRKPPGHYWLLGLYEMAFGPGEVVWRLPSMIASALLAAFIAVMSRRWFGTLAGWVGGLSYITLIAIWPQSITADIDAHNTLFATAAGLCFIELGFGQTNRRYLWAIAASLLTAATIYMKFHAGLTVVGGALVGASIANRQFAWLKRPVTWLPLIGATVLFGLWVVAVKIQSTDTSGLTEAAKQSAFNWKKLYLTPMSFGLTFLAAFPPAIGLFCWKAYRDNPIYRALLGTIAGAMALFFLALTDTPRYWLIVLPTWCPLAGAAAKAWADDRIEPKSKRQMCQIVSIYMIGAAIALIVLAVLLWSTPSYRVLTITAAVTGTVLAVIGLIRGANDRLDQLAVFALGVTILLSVSIGRFYDRHRYEESVKPAAQVIRNTLPHGEKLTIGYMHRIRPDVLYYAGLSADDTITLGQSLVKPRPLTGPRWMLLDKHEYPAWENSPYANFTKVIKLNLAGQPIYLVLHQGSNR